MVGNKITLSLSNNTSGSKMSRYYVIYDPEVNLYVNRQFGDRVDFFAARRYRRRAAAVEAAALINIRRNIPAGVDRANSRHYQNRPNAVVHEYDVDHNKVAEIPCPPQYIYL